jgi:DNA-binding NarL/FixJ family response regulator
VKTHLSHIFSKLGATNRTELAAAATDHGIADTYS